MHATEDCVVAFSVMTEVTGFHQADNVTFSLASGLAQVLLCRAFVDVVNQAFPTLGLAFADWVAGESRSVKQ
ncbi:hypothetical protein PPS11_02129 [Pseudomonas putida S11]|nr:hypothetical protein PPS11_02129 [Pseudomonas putida S11]